MSLPKVVVLATRNAHKVTEIRQILGGHGTEFKTLDDFPGIKEAVEDAPDFRGNALKKALAVCLATGLPALADDSGLEVDALGREPGVRSARYSGKGTEGNNALLLEKLEGVPEEKRTARFRCVVALCMPGKEPFVAEGKVEGSIIREGRGRDGFGYDPLFTPLGHNKTFAEIAAEEKNAMSHRGNALKALKKSLEAL